MLRVTGGGEGEGSAQLGSACPLPAGLQASPEDAGRVPSTESWHCWLQQAGTQDHATGPAGAFQGLPQAGRPSRRLWATSPLGASWLVSRSYWDGTALKGTS